MFKFLTLHYWKQDLGSIKSHESYGNKIYFTVWPASAKLSELYSYRIFEHDSCTVTAE
jgi:hypothetical protein